MRRRRKQSRVESLHCTGKTVTILTSMQATIHLMMMTLIVTQIDHACIIYQVKTKIHLSYPFKIANSFFSQ